MSNQGTECSVLVSALNTRLPHISSDTSSGDESSPFHITFPPYVPTEIQPLMSEGDFNVRAKCLARLTSVHEQDDSVQNYCIFFFEVGTRTAGLCLYRTITDIR